IGWRELDGKANAAWHADRLLVEFAGGRPRHKSNANPAASTGQRMGQECARPPPSGPRGVRRGSGAPERRLRSPRASLQLRGDAARTSRAWGEDAEASRRPAPADRGLRWPLAGDRTLRLEEPLPVRLHPRHVVALEDGRGLVLAVEPAAELAGLPRRTH